MESGTHLRILLIDDNPVDVAETVDSLAQQGFDAAVRVARGGQEALDYLFGRGQFQARRRHPLPDLVLLDLNMPLPDGYGVLRQLQENESLRRIPVVILCMSEAEARRASDHGLRANHFLVKPICASAISELRRLYDNWTLRLDLPVREAPGSRVNEGSR